ncbi:hypothetical protein D3C80_2066200 [compost metagenome]
MAQTDWPMTAPRMMPAIAARPKPYATRSSETSTRKPRPISCEPFWKNGDTMRS